MKRQSLDGIWKLWGYAEGTCDIRNPEDLLKTETESYKAAVPGNVELDLVRAGVLDDPYFGCNVMGLQQYEAYEWWYQTTFDVSGELRGARLELLFEGVDCYASYWLNGRPIGKSSNMLVEHAFDVTDLLDWGGPNTLMVHIAPSTSASRLHPYEPGMAAWGGSFDSFWIRKAPHMFGWDIMPRVLSAGIWRGVSLVSHENLEFSTAYFTTRQARDRWARLSFGYEIKGLRTGEPDYEISLTGKLKNTDGAASAKCWKIRQPLFLAFGRLDFDLNDVELWWPRGYGDAALYEVSIELLHKGKTVASHIETIGIRTLELDRTDTTSVEKPGQFLFKVNGTPIMCKGPNWVPADAFHSNDTNRYDAMMELLTDLESNMVRCWGGNVYEADRFFELCDENGVMVWQDFAMACGCYPQMPEFCDMMRQEAVKVVRRLRNHPSLALWCGDNECDEALAANGMDPGRNRITREILPDVLFMYDPYRPYIPSSPYMPPEVAGTGKRELMPEQHLWGPRDYYKSRFYSESTAHFVSEIGYHGCPNVSSMKKFLAPEALWPYENNEQWRVHCTDPVPGGSYYSYRVQLMADQIKELFGCIPDNLEQFVIASQISQGEAKKFFIESARLKKWSRTGVLWWNLIDGWPQFSDAVVDYYYGKKLAYYYIKRVQQPVCIMMDEPDSWYSRVVVGNDSNREVSGKYSIRDGESDEVLLSGSFTAHPNRNSELGRIRVSHGEQRLFLLEWTFGPKDDSYGNHYILGKPPLSFERYRLWLDAISNLPLGFDPSTIGK